MITFKHPSSDHLELSPPQSLSTPSMMQTFPFVTIYTDAPETLLVQLHNCQDVGFLAIQQVQPTILSRYTVIEDVYTY